MIIFAQVAAQSLDKAAEHFVADPVAVGITGNSNHMLLGYDHGMGVTWDGGRNWYHPDELPLAQLYQVGYDMQYPYNVYGGLQDNGSVRGPSSKRGGAAITFEDWQTVGGGDGFFNVVDPVTNRYLYNESQFGAISRLDLFTGESRSISPRDPALRLNWSSPILVSPHDPAVIYFATNKLLRSPTRGDTWVEVSPDLTTNDAAKMPTGKGGDGNIQYCTITALDESTIARGLVWVGTDDGNAWVTKNVDDMKAWTRLNDKVTGNPGYWVSHIVASHHQAETAYLTYTGYRHDDFRPFVYKTTDFGQTWTSIAGNLPNKAVNVVIEDAKNPNLLFAGVDFGLYVTIDSGKTWTEMKGLPTQPVYDLEIHPRENELIVATHGRGFFITDISPLQELDQQVLGQDIYLFDVKPQVNWVTRREPVSASINFRGPSAPAGMVISYYEKAPVAGEITVQIMQGSRGIAETKGPNAAGLNQVIWTMRINPTVLVQPAQGAGRGGGRGGGGAGGAGGGFGGRGGGAGAAAVTSFGGTVAVQPGEYTIVVRAGGKTLAKKTRILEDVWFDKVF